MKKVLLLLVLSFATTTPSSANQIILLNPLIQKGELFSDPTWTAYTAVDSNFTELYGNISGVNTSLSTLLTNETTDASNISTLQSNVTTLQTTVATLKPQYFATSTSIGGSLLVAGSCSTQAVTVTGATTSMTAVVSPQSSPGTGVQWQAYVSSANTVTVWVCALVAVTPTSTSYNIRVIQ